MTNMIKDSVNESLNNHIDKFVKNQSKKTKKEQEELSYIIESLRNEPTNNRNILNSSITKKFDKRIKQERKEELSNSELLECYQDLMTKNAHLLFYMNLALSNPETLESVKHRYVETICNRYINKIGILDEMDLTVLRKYHNILPKEKEEKTSVRKYDGVMKKTSYNDFEFIRTLGKGAFSVVYLVRRKEDQKEYKYFKEPDIPMIEIKKSESTYNNSKKIGENVFFNYLIMIDHVIYPKRNYLRKGGLIKGSSLLLILLNKIISKFILKTVIN